MRTGLLVGGFLLATLAARPTLAQSASSGQHAAFSSVHLAAVPPISSSELMSATIERGKRRSALLMQTTVSLYSGTGDSDNLVLAMYVEGDQGGSVLPSTYQASQACPVLGGGCSVTLVAYLDLDDSQNAIFVNKPAKVELFVFNPSGAGIATVDGTLAVQLVRK